MDPVVTRRRSSLVMMSLLALAGACGGASSDPGLGALMRATGAQYVPGELMDDMNAPGPTVDFVSTNSTTVNPGLPSRTFTGSASHTATAVMIGLSGDDAHWIVPTGTMDSDQPGNYTFQTALSFSSALPLGPRTLVFRAVDASGEVGVSRDLGIKVQVQVPSGALVVTLTWDTEADLDLHVTVPNAMDPTMPVIVWSRAPLALPMVPLGGTPYTADQIASAGALDGDSNSGCVIDGRRQEDLIFPVAPAPAPPAGTYEVRVDASSMCGQGVARWHAIAVANGDVDNPLGEAVGQLTDLDAAGTHVATSGILAFTFSMP
jgi:hypothetical protein